MNCPKCNSDQDKVIDSRTASTGKSIYRRRCCLDCGERWTTYETTVAAPDLLERYKALLARSRKLQKDLAAAEEDLQALLDYEPEAKSCMRQK